MKHQINPIARQTDLIVQEVEDEILIYDLRQNKAFYLNETSSLVWQLCDGERTIFEISTQLSKQLNSNITEEFVWLAIDQLKEDDLLDDSEELNLNPNGLSRREVISGGIATIGIATMVALPVVASIVVPTAAAAVSPGLCRSGGETCTYAGGEQGDCCADLVCCPNANGVNVCVIPALGCGDASVQNVFRL